MKKKHLATYRFSFAQHRGSSEVTPFEKKHIQEELCNWSIQFGDPWNFKKQGGWIRCIAILLSSWMTKRPSSIETATSTKDHPTRQGHFIFFHTVIIENPFARSDNSNAHTYSTVHNITRYYRPWPCNAHYNFHYINMKNNINMFITLHHITSLSSISNCSTLICIISKDFMQYSMRMIP